MQNHLSRSLRLAAAGLIIALISSTSLRADEPAVGSSVPVSPKLAEKKKADENRHAAPQVSKPKDGQLGSSIPVLHPLTLKDPTTVPSPTVAIFTPRLMCQGSAGTVSGGAVGDGKSSTVSANAGCSGTLQFAPGSTVSFQYEGSAGVAGTLPVGSAKVAILFRNGTPDLDKPAVKGSPDEILAASFRANPVVVGAIPSFTFRLGSPDDTRGSHVAAGFGMMGYFQDRVTGLPAFEFIEGQAEATLALSKVLALDVKGTYGLYTAFNSNTPTTVTDIHGAPQKVLPSSTGGSLLHAEADFRLHTGQNFWVAVYGSTDQLKYQVDLNSPTDSVMHADLGSVSWGAGIIAGGAISQ
jgi:hypothetical protein